jgi:hypothetical protein
MLRWFKGGMYKYYAILYKELEHPWILVSALGPETNPKWILRNDCMRQQ